MKKILLINSILSLGISSLVANATLDEMYKEMRDIANSEIEVKKAVTTEPVAVIETKVTQKSDVKIKTIEKKVVEDKIVTLKPALVAPKASNPTKPTKAPEVKNTVVQPIKTVPTVVTIPDIAISLPLPPKVPTVVSVKNVNGDIVETHDRTIKFSKRVPPNYTGPKFGKAMVAVVSTKEVKVGEVNAGKISAYLRGELLEVEEVKKRLKDAGFNILTSLKLDKKGDLVSIVFTNTALIGMSSKAGRGFASTLRILVNKKDKKISITNPLYLLKAFLQDDFDKASASKLLTALGSKFGKLKDSDDSLKFQLLPKYQFMNGMPYYKDTVVVASGDDILEKIKDNKRVLFEQKLDNGSVVIGISLNKRTNGFLKKIGSKNAAMLPLLVLIEDAKATILDPKYYLSIMYPKLTMEEFMKIATVPDSMVKDSKRVFR